MQKKLRYLLSALFILALFSCTSHRADIDNSLKKYFDDNKVEGCFTMFNNSNGEVSVYNMAMDTARVSPDGTFDIVNALIGLHTGRILDDSMLMEGQNMIDAFKTNNVKYFQAVARRIGPDTMRSWMDSIKYGNKDISGGIDSFWLNNHLKISPDEQLGFIKRLYFDQLSFRKSVQQNLREVMLKEDSSQYRFAYKTGIGYNEKGNGQGWVVGWIEENMHIHFFVTFFKAADATTDISATGMKITRSILKEYGFFEGKK